MTPYERFVAAAYDHGERPALCVGGALVRYAELAARATTVRRGLEAHGIGRGARVGIRGRAADVHTVAAVLGALAAGAAYVPLGEARTGVAAAADVAAVCGAARVAREDAQRLGVPLVDPAALAPRDVDWSLPQVDEGDLCYVLATSGSTGRPKLVPITIGNVVAFLGTALGVAEHALGPDARFLQMFEPTFDLWVASTFVPLSVGACSYVISSDAPVPAAVLGALERHALTFALMVPSVLAYLRSELGAARLPALRTAQLCGEALPRPWVEALCAAAPNARVENLYGPTEATVYCTRYEWSGERSAAQCVNGVVPIGHATAGNVIELLDSGELVIAGPQVMPGYLDGGGDPFVPIRHEGATLRAYRTGDLARPIDGGGFAFLGRLDEQLKIDGYRVEPAELEHETRALCGAPAAAVAVPVESGARELHLVVEARRGSARDVLEGLRERVPGHMLPRAVHLWEELPLTANGKIDRREIERRLRTRAR